MITKNQWEEAFRLIGRAGKIHPEIVDEFIYLAKIELSSVRKETLEAAKELIRDIMAEPTELADVKIYNQALKDAINHLLALDKLE